MLSRLKEKYILVLGDLMVDKYIVGTVDRISPEAPVPVLHQRQVVRKLGGAGNVVLNLCALEARVRVIGRIGNDLEGSFIQETLNSHGVDSRYLLSSGATIVKTRVSANHQQFLRIDEEEQILTTKMEVDALSSRMDDILRDISVIVISDYAKGFITEDVAQLVIQAANSYKIPVIVDPKGKSAAKYRGATAITPNTKEFFELTDADLNSTESEILKTGLALCDEYQFDYLILTRSEKGISTVDREKREKQDFPAVQKEVIDVTGAGDTVISVIALSMAAGYPLEQCVKMANEAASIVISKFGASQVTLGELETAMFGEKGNCHNIETLMPILTKLKKKGKRIVFTNGCFDIVHAGHISSFLQAKSFGDVLVVGVNSDDSIRRIKGPERPIIDLKNRVFLLSQLDCVDYVIPFEEDTPETLIQTICPDVLVKGKDWEGKEVAGGKFVCANGGRVEFIELEQGLSTTNIIEKIRHMMS